LPRQVANLAALTPRQVFAQQAMMQRQMMLAQRQQMGRGANPQFAPVPMSMRQQNPMYKRPPQSMMPAKGQYQGPGAYVPPKPIPNRVAMNPKLAKKQEPIEVLPTPRKDRMPGGNGPEPLIPRERYSGSKQATGISRLPSPKRDRMPDLRQDSHPYIPD